METTQKRVYEWGKRSGPKPGRKPKVLSYANYLRKSDYSQARKDLYFKHGYHFIDVGATNTVSHIVNALKKGGYQHANN